MVNFFHFSLFYVNLLFFTWSFGPVSVHVKLIQVNNDRAAK